MIPCDNIVHQGQADYNNWRFKWTRPRRYILCYINVGSASIWLRVWTMMSRCVRTLCEWFAKRTSGWDMRRKMHSDKTRIQPKYIRIPYISRFVLPTEARTMSFVYRVFADLMHSHRISERCINSAASRQANQEHKHNTICHTNIHAHTHTSSLPHPHIVWF